MWKDFVALVTTVFTLSKDLAQTKEDIKEIRQNILSLTLALQRLSDEIKLNQQEIKHAKDLAATERENIILKLQLKLTEFEQRLPPAKTEKPQRRLPPARKDKDD